MLAILADDQALVREALSQVLAFHFRDLEVLQARNAAEAVVLCRKHNPNLVIMDLMMPGIDTFDAVAEIRLLRPQSKVMILTGRADESLILRARNRNVNGYVLKGDDPEELRYAVRTVLNGGFYAPPSMSAKVIGRRQAEQDTTTFDSLTPKERSVLTLLAQGFQMKEVASHLCISVKTVETHRNNLGRKLRHPNRAQMFAFAVTHSLIDPHQLAMQTL